MCLFMGRSRKVGTGRKTLQPLRERLKSIQKTQSLLARRHKSVFKNYSSLLPGVAEII